MTYSTNPTIDLRVQQVVVAGRTRLVAHATYASGTGAGIPIDTQDDLWRTAADHRVPREQVVFGDGASRQFDQLP